MKRSPGSADRAREDRARSLAMRCIHFVAWILSAVRLRELKGLQCFGIISVGLEQDEMQQDQPSCRYCGQVQRALSDAAD
jgi:hypothetical protein